MFPLGDGICEGGLRAKCRTSDDIYDYIYVSQGKTKVVILIFQPMECFKSHKG